MELLANGANMESVSNHLLKNFGSPVIPHSIVKYLWCSPSMDFKFRFLPTDGGYYDQRYRDLVEFSIIEKRLRDVVRRNR